MSDDELKSNDGSDDKLEDECGCKEEEEEEEEEEEDDDDDEEEIEVIVVDEEVFGVDASSSSERFRTRK